MSRALKMHAGLLAPAVAAGIGTAVLWTGCGSDHVRPVEECVLSVDTVAFGAVSVGDTLVREAAVVNAGRSSLNLVAALESPDFELVPGDSVPVTLGAGDTTRLTLRFTPLPAGEKSAEIEFSGRTCPAVPVTGTALPPVVAGCTLEADTLAFGEVLVGDSLVRDAVVTNLGAKPLDLVAVLQSPDFSLVAGDLVSIHLAVGDSAALSVRFAPSTAGTKSAEIRFLDDTCPVVPVTGVARVPQGTVVSGAFSVDQPPVGVAVAPDGAIYVDFELTSYPPVLAPPGAVYAADGTVIKTWTSIGGVPDGLAAGPGDAFYLVDASRGVILNGSRAAGVEGSIGINEYSPGQFGFPEDVTMDENGFIYVADAGAGRVQKLAADGEYVDSWWMQYPHAVQADRHGRVHVCWTTPFDFTSHTSTSALTTYSTAGEVLSNVLQWTLWGYGGDFVAATAIGDGSVYAILGDVYKYQDGGTVTHWRVGHGLHDVAEDRSGHLYCVDSDSLYKITTDGERVASWPYYGIAVAVDSTLGVFVLDGNRITRLTTGGEFIERWGGTGTGEGEFQNSHGIGITLDGTILVADAGNQRIQELTPDGAFLRELGAIPDGRPLGPTDVARDAQGNLYVCGVTDDLVQKLAPDGTFVTKWGGPGQDPGEFDSPRGIAVGGSGHVYVWDTGNRRVQVFDSRGGFLSAWAPMDASGFAEPGPIVSNEARSAGIAVTPDDVVYLADYAGNRVVAFSAHGAPLGSVGGPGSGPGLFEQPRDVAVGPDGRIVVADYGNRRIQIFEPPPLQ